MPQKKLMDVFQEAFNNASFRQELLEDHRAALKSRSYELSGEDMLKLDGFMSGDQIVDPATILNAFSDVLKGTAPPPPPPWQPRFPLDEPSK
jgi:hypothetical protein